MSIKFSIITPSFNRVRFIKKTIESVLNQSYSAFEYIVIDGQSTDGTVALIDSYKYKGALQYLSEPDDGMYDAINKGFKMATGDVIAYLNTDDLYLPWTLSSVAACFEAHPDVDVVFGDSFIVNLKENISFLNIRPSFNPLWLYAGSRIAQPTVFIRSNCFAAVGAFQQEVALLADCEYWLRLVENGYKIHKANEFLAIEVNHTDTIRETKRGAVEREKKYLIDKYAHRLPNPMSTVAVLKMKKIETLFHYLRFVLKNKSSIRSGDWGKTLENINISFNPVPLLCNKIDGKKRQVWNLNLDHLLN